MKEPATRDLVAIREGLLTGNLHDLRTVRLAGSRCLSCDEVALGGRDLCPNCGSDRLEEITLAEEGTLWTYTVSRHRPPGNYRGPEPFHPFAVALVELPEGIRVMTPLLGDIHNLRIGMPVRFAPYVREDDERDVVAFAFTTGGEGPVDV